MYKLAFCDDDKTLINYIKTVIEREFSVNNLETFSKLFSSGTSLLKAIERGERFDVYFLDISMPVIDGICIGTTIRNSINDTNFAIVYISEKEEKIFDSLKNSPLYFIRKNFLLSDSKYAVSAILNYFTHENEKAFFQKLDNGSIVKLKFDEIIYIESLGRKQIIITPKNKYTALSKLEDLEQTLINRDFIKPHRSYLVNCKYIHLIEKDTIYMDNGKLIPLSRLRKNDVTTAFMEYIQKTKS